MEYSARNDNLLGESPAFSEALEHTSLVAKLNKPILIIGERGTGKELFAARMHYLSSRWDQPFLKLNCAAISEALLETELFGHESGAFTGAAKKHIGRFELADGGSLFLDELATMSPRVQEKLLRVIEYGEFERVGGSKTIKTDVRLIAATNEDLPALVAQKRFRADLLDRLAFDVLTLPPLRYRQEDILLLAEHFAVEMTKELQRDYFPGFSESAQTELLNYPWPGNIRELKNVVERNVYRYVEGVVIDEILFDPFESPFRPISQSNVNTDATVSALPISEPDVSVKCFPIDLKQETQAFEMKLIQNALEEGQFNQRKTAELLSLTYHQLRGYLKKYQLLD